MGFKPVAISFLSHKAEAICKSKSNFLCSKVGAS